MSRVGCPRLTTESARYHGLSRHEMVAATITTRVIRTGGEEATTLCLASDDQLTQHSFAARGFDLDHVAPAEPEAEILDQRAAVAERLRRPDGAVDAIFVRDREHLFGRQVRGELDPRSAGRVAAHPDVACRQADRELGAWT